MGRLTADFAKAFSRDLKKNAKRRNWNLTELEKVIDLVVENTPETLEEQKADLEAQMAAHDPSDYEGLGKLNEQLQSVIERFSRILRTHRQPRRIIPVNRR